MGQRIKKVTSSGTKVFHYDSGGRIIAETDATGQMLAEHIYLGDQLLATIRPGEAVYYYHNDHLGTPQVLTDVSGNVAWKAVYAPFGKVQISVATVENSFRFPGQYYDSETGLSYNYFRYYKPEIGRYISPDPIGLDGGINPFVYVEGNPVMLADPRGLTVYRCFGVIRTYPHAYVCVNRACAGLMPNPSCVGGGEVQGEEFNPKHCQEVNPGGCCDKNKFENCVRNLLLSKLGTCDRYIRGLYNCISWVNVIIATCTAESCEKK